MKQAVIAERIVHAIQERIAKYESVADDLAHDYIQSDKPFPSDLKQRYDNIGNIVEGLQEAMCIVMNGVYMHEDVDLTGGEEQ